jgi:hypothetical protein
MRLLNLLIEVARRIGAQPGVHDGHYKQRSQRCAEQPSNRGPAQRRTLEVLPFFNTVNRADLDSAFAGLTGITRNLCAVAMETQDMNAVIL